MNLKQTAVVVAIIAGVVGAAGGYLGATMQVDAKVDQAMRPVNRQLDQIVEAVRDIRGLLDRILLAQSGKGD